MSASASGGYTGPATQYVKVSSVNRVKKFQPRPIGYRGRHDHGKIDDPVYPVKTLPYELRQTHGADWRSGGRMLLIAGMAMLEDGSRMRSPGQIFGWQRQGYCGPRCESQCAKHKDRIYCTWRVPGSLFENVNALDGFLIAYKGVIESQKPIYSVTRKVASRNRFHAIPYMVQEHVGTDQSDSSLSNNSSSYGSRGPGRGEVHSLLGESTDRIKNSGGQGYLVPVPREQIHPAFELDLELFEHTFVKTSAPPNFKPYSVNPHGYRVEANFGDAFSSNEEKVRKAHASKFANDFGSTSSTGNLDDGTADQLYDPTKDIDAPDPFPEDEEDVERCLAAHGM